MGTASRRERVDFHLEKLAKAEIKKKSKIWDGGNLSLTLNLAVEYYLHCRETKDKGLEKFLKDRLEA